MRSRLLAAAAACALVLPLPALALCDMLCSCSASTTPVAFGSYNPLLGTALDGTGNVRVTCGGVVGLLVPFDVAIDRGANSDTFTPRKMANGANRLAYGLYTTSGRTTVWGDGTDGTQLGSGSILILLISGTSQDLPVYGRIPGGQQTVPPGSYSDTTVVTVTYY